jgi:hypothetical protein
LADNELMLVLDYNSRLPVRESVPNASVQAQGGGRLVMYHETAATRFLRCHAKNLAHRLAIQQHDAQVLVNLDADNLLTPQYLTTLRRHNFALAPVLAPYMHCDGCRGRTAISATAFKALGGYDEAMIYGYGYEEIDLEARAIASKIKLNRVQLNAATGCLPNTDAARAASQMSGFSIRDSNVTHRHISEANIRRRQLQSTFHPGATVQAADGSTILIQPDT